MKGTVWMAFFSACLLGVTVDTVIIRDYRAKAKLSAGSVLTGDQEVGERRAHQGRHRRKSFRPSTARCCKIGYKMAKRKMSCNVRVLELVRQYNDLQRAKIRYNRPRKVKPPKISAKLSNKLGKCAASFPKFFEKCCKYREQYYKGMAKCKTRPGKERRSCRQSIRRRFKSPRGGGGGGRGHRQRQSKGRKRPRHRS